MKVGLNVPALRATVFEVVLSVDEPVADLERGRPCVMSEVAPNFSTGLLREVLGKVPARPPTSGTGCLLRVVAMNGSLLSKIAVQLVPDRYRGLVFRPARDGATNLARCRSTSRREWSQPARHVCRVLP